MKSSPYLRFLNRLLMLTLIIAAAGWLVITNLPFHLQTPAFPYIIIFFFSTTLILHRILLKSAAQRFAQFANRFMLITFLKIVFFLFVMLIYAFFVNRPDAVPFIVTFFSYYLIFTAFELVEILQFGKKE